jgi:hypothetical protein
VAVVTSLTVTSPQADPLAAATDGSDAGVPDADDEFDELVGWVLRVGVEVVPPELAQAARLAQISAAAPTASEGRDRMDCADRMMIKVVSLGALGGLDNQQDRLGDPVDREMPGVVDGQDGLAGQRLEHAEAGVLRWHIDGLEVADCGSAGLLGADACDAGHRPS